MPSSGTGTGTPIGPGTPSGVSGIADPLPYTLLSLARYAKIMGINPVHFQGAVGTATWLLQNNKCEDIWPRYSWQQSDLASHQELAEEIAQAERDVASILGFYPAPVWIGNELHPFPRFYRNELTDGGGRQFYATSSRRKSVNTNWKKVIAGGQRAVTLIGTATTAAGTLVYTDEDGDGWSETATITLPTALTDACEIKLYQPSVSADRRWEIRDVRSKTISGGNVIIVADSWLFVDPGLIAAYPTDAGFGAVDITTTANYIISVDVYREYNDTSTVASQFYWEPRGCAICSNCSVTINGTIVFPVSGVVAASASTCPTCGFSAQDGCLLTRDTELGIVIPAPATYDSDSGVYVESTYAIARDPDQVKLWYYAGQLSDYRLGSYTCEPLSDSYARIIAWIATARLERPFAACGNIIALANDLRIDLAFTGTDSSYLLDFDELSNPLGTRKGEIMAWRRLSKMDERILDGASI